MLDVKKLLTKILQRINGLTAKYEYVSNVGSTIFNGTWTAPNDGMIVAIAQWNNGHAGGYWYIIDQSQDGNYVCTISTDYTNQFRESSSFPVIKGHVYFTSDKSAVNNATAYFYKLVVGGVVSRLLYSLINVRGCCHA